jgi:hypothetical protein
MAGLVAGQERVVNVAFDAISLPADGMDYGMAVAPQFGVFGREALDRLEGFTRGMLFKGRAKELIVRRSGREFSDADVVKCGS